ncbi:MAG: M56 family metallopeptidase [Tetrasphaera sp.]|nr:M56 family metallopeptidase [Tetrasphaera sp.]
MPPLSTWLPVAGLVLLAVLLTWPVQKAMVRRHIFRREPLLALLVWQAVALAAVVSLLAALPLALWVMRESLTTTPLALGVAVVAAVITASMVVRLLLAGHQVGTSLRRTRRAHRELLELVGHEFDELDQPTPQLRVIQHPAPTAYCVPGLTHRVVISTGMLEQLGPPEVRAVLAHERAHVRARHDLLVEFFTVLHTAMPKPLRHEDVLAEVRLLAEVLADRSGARTAGRLPMGRALVALAGAQHPAATLGAASDSVSAAQVRLRLLTEDGRRDWIMVATMIGYAMLAVAAPLAVVVWVTALSGAR